ncbi:hypothetical protein [Streptomyces sp. NPDC060243]|uniref:hypothetical protein n=1 Tax=Streptomyces sp. NPDC060243 TaxID=3347081 RepID=UPI00365FAF86
MDPLPLSRRALLGLSALTGAVVLVGCSDEEAPSSGKSSVGRKKPAPTATDVPRLRDQPPAAEGADARSPADAWRYSHVPERSGAGYRAMAVTSRDDVWLLGVTGMEAKNPGPAKAFLDHWDGSAWRERELPSDLRTAGVSAGTWAWGLAASRADELWLVHVPGRDEGRPRVYRFDGKDWHTLPALPEVPEEAGGGDHGGMMCVAGGHVWLRVGRRVAHFDGEKWDVPKLPFEAHALTAAPDGDGEPRVWVVGMVEGTCEGAGECSPQPASARWADGAWQRMRTPEYHFPDPVPPEAWATLDTVTYDPVSQQVWAFGANDFNHGEVDEEPASRGIVLRGDGTRWHKAEVGDATELRASGLACPDGTGGFLIDTWERLDKDGHHRSVKAPARLPEPHEIPMPPRKYDFDQPMDPAVAALIPGTRTVLAAGVVTFNNSSDDGNPPLRPVLARYDPR